MSIKIISEGKKTQSSTVQTHSFTNAGADINLHVMNAATETSPTDGKVTNAADLNATHSEFSDKFVGFDAQNSSALHKSSEFSAIPLDFQAENPSASPCPATQVGSAHSRPFSELLRADDTLDRALRPIGFENFVGQDHVVRNLKVFIQAAHARDESLDHVLLSGPPGLGKTTLAHLIARTLGGKLRTTSGPVLTKPGDLAALLTQLQPKDVVFIDEIHRLPIAVEELLYSAMEDYRIDILLGQGPAARALQLNLPPFTLVGATTRSGLLSAPLRDRFGIALALEFYAPEALATLIDTAAGTLGIAIMADAAVVLAQRSRGTPRIALRLLRRVRDFTHASGLTIIGVAEVSFALDQLGVNAQGLDLLDQKYLHVMNRFFHGGPTGLDTLCAALSETRDTVQDVIEPYLLQSGLIQRTPRGRQLTARAQSVLVEFDH